MAKPAKKSAKPSSVTPDGIPKKVAQVVSGAGTDEEIRARCAADVDGWADLSEQGKADLVRLFRHYETMPTAPRMAVNEHESGTKTIGPPADGNMSLFAMRLTEALGTSSGALVDARVADLANYFASTGKGLTSDNLSAAIAFIHGSKASNPVEAGLVTQMAATHDAAMSMLRRMSGAEYVETFQTCGNLANKLLNTYARQAEALAKLQRGGEQVVRHVHVNQGGQAVIAETVNVGGSRSNVAGPSHATSAALLGADPFGNGVPIASREREAALSDARRTQ